MRLRNESNEAADWQCIVKSCYCVWCDNVRRLRGTLPVFASSPPRRLESHHKYGPSHCPCNVAFCRLCVCVCVFLLPLSLAVAFFVQFILILFYHIIYVRRATNCDWNNRRWGGKIEAWSEIEHKGSQWKYSESTCSWFNEPQNRILYSKIFDDFSQDFFNPFIFGQLSTALPIAIRRFIDICVWCVAQLTARTHARSAHYLSTTVEW